MKKASTCTICQKSKSAYILNNRTVCLRCDELMFDIEIECEEEPMYLKKTEPTTTQPQTTQAVLGRN